MGPLIEWALLNLHCCISHDESEPNRSLPSSDMRKATTSIRHAYQRVRAFSSSSPRDPLPPINAWEVLQRIVERRSLYMEYKSDGVLPRDASFLKSLMLFSVAQLPSQTHIDLREFLDGATFAVANVLKATSSRDFTHFAVGQSTESTNASRLREWCTPICFDMMVDNVRHSWEHHRMFEVESVQVDWISLSMARYDRVSQAELAADSALAQQVKMNRAWSPEANLERLQLNVALATTERTRQTRLDEKRARVVDSRWFYQAALLSDVTRPEAVDWRVAAVAAERGLGESLVSEAPLDEP